MLVSMSVREQRVTVEDNHNCGKMALRVILHLDQPVVGFLNKKWLLA